MLVEILREGAHTPTLVVYLELEAAPLGLEVFGQKGGVCQR
jgi:hypothetical protein